MALQPLPQEVLTAHKLREQAKMLLLLADELEAAALKKMPPQRGTGVFLFGEVMTKRKRGGKR